MRLIREWLPEDALKRTLVVWRRLGKEHGETSGFRLNPAAIVHSSLKGKVEAFAKTPEDDWRWWQVGNGLIVEKPLDTRYCGPDALIYYLPQKSLVILENARFAGSEEWPWYVHVGKVDYVEDLGGWVFTDHFVDVLVKADTRTHTIVDLNDLGEALSMGLVSTETARQILNNAEGLVHSLRQGNFPPSELSGREVVLKRLGWL